MADSHTEKSCGECGNSASTPASFASNGSSNRHRDRRRHAREEVDTKSYYIMCDCLTTGDYVPVEQEEKQQSTTEVFELLNPTL